MREDLTRHDITEKDAEILKSRIEGREKQIKELEEEYKKYNNGKELKLDKDKLEKAQKDTDFVRSLLGGSSSKQEKEQPKKEDTSSKEGKDIIQKYEDKIPKNYKRDKQTKLLWLYKNNYITRSEWEKERNVKNSLDSIINNALTEVIVENCLGE